MSFICLFYLIFLFLSSYRRYKWNNAILGFLSKFGKSSLFLKYFLKMTLSLKSWILLWINAPQFLHPSIYKWQYRNAKISIDICMISVLMFNVLCIDIQKWDYWMIIYVVDIKLFCQEALYCFLKWFWPFLFTYFIFYSSILLKILLY